MIVQTKLSIIRRFKRLRYFKQMVTIQRREKR